jgi:hypothetical protein
LERLTCTVYHPKMKLTFPSEFAAFITSACCFCFHCPFIAKFICVQTWVAEMQIEFFFENTCKTLREICSVADFTHLSTRKSSIFRIGSSGERYLYYYCALWQFSKTPALWTDCWLLTRFFIVRYYPHVHQFLHFRPYNDTVAGLCKYKCGLWVSCTESATWESTSTSL